MKNEINILKSLDHPNIVKFIDVYEDKWNLQIVTEYCDGGELFERITQRGNYTEADCAEVMYQLLDGLRYMHSQGVIHCDLKPDNFLFSSKKDNRIKIIDFGMSKRLPRLEKLNTLCGTPYYTAPEILKKSYSHAADMWSIGVVMFVMLFGYPPFYVDPAYYGKKENDAIYRKIQKGFDPTTRKGYGSHFPATMKCSDEAKDLMKHLMTLDPKERPTAQEALDHKWIRERKNMQNEIPRTVINALIDFKKNCGFKDTVCRTFRSKLRPYQINAVKDAFATFDKNGDGKISKAEFVEVMKEKKIDEETYEEMFEAIDHDKNHEIDYDELLAATYAQHIQSQDERLYEQFTSLDLNGDGYITPEEMEQILKQDDDMTDEKIKQALLHIKEADLNFDGKIDYQEFLQALHPEINSTEEVPTHYRNDSPQAQVRSLRPPGAGEPMDES